MGLLDQVQTASRRLPSRIFLYAGEKWGKTSLAASAPGAIFIMSRGETGLLSLIDAGRIPPTPHLPEAKTWGDLLNGLRALQEEQHDYKTLILDTSNGFERLCLESVCRDQFDDNWKDFDAYGRGVTVAVGEWVRFLDQLDAVRSRRQMAVILLAHCKVKAFKNPTGTDYDRYQPDCVDKLWSLTHKWADVILFGSYVVREIKTGQKDKVKAAGGQERVIHTERSATYDAGNRYGLPATIHCGSDAKKAWEALAAAIGKARAGAPEQKVPPAEKVLPDPKPTPAPSGPAPVAMIDSKQAKEIDRIAGEKSIDDETFDLFLRKYDKPRSGLTFSEAADLIKRLSEYKPGGKKE